MENYSYSSYPDSGASSPRSRETDYENASWEEPLSNSNYKVKFMCSYGGKIQPRPHDNQLTYVGGDTKILAVDRNIRFAAFMAKLSGLCDSEVCFKYQLPGEDLDALISVTNDEDLEHMMLEYDRLSRASAKQTRLRLFLFPANIPATGFGTGDTKSERQWFVDALNSVQIQPHLENSSTPAAAANPDFLFGLESRHTPPTAVAKVHDPPLAPSTVPEIFSKDSHAGSDCGSEDRHVIGEPVVSPAEIHRQIHEFQRMQISAANEQGIYHRKSDEANPRAYPGEYYVQKFPEQVPTPQQAVPMTISPGYWQERHVAIGGYPVGAPTGPEQPVYLVQTPVGVYQSPALRPMTGQVAGHAYYGMQRVDTEPYREQPVYNPVPPSSIQQPVGMVRQPTVGPRYPPAMYEAAGRQVYYTAAGGMMPPYQAVDVRQGGGGALNQESGNVVVKSTSQASSV